MPEPAARPEMTMTRRMLPPRISGTKTAPRPVPARGLPKALEIGSGGRGNLRVRGDFLTLQELLVVVVSDALDVRVEQAAAFIEMLDINRTYRVGGGDAQRGHAETAQRPASGREH